MSLLYFSFLGLSAFTRTIMSLLIMLFLSIAVISKQKIGARYNSKILSQATQIIARSYMEMH